LTRALSKFLTDDSSASVFLKTSLRPLLRKRQRP
jgi:hypothetical protein